MCRDSLAAFDKILLDLRKFGFSLITILLSANGFLFVEVTLNAWAVMGIYLAILVLIVGLFRMDRVYHVFIRAVALRALKLEEVMPPPARPDSLGWPYVGLTFEISYWSERLRTDTWGHFLYIVFCLAAGVLAASGIVSSKTPYGYVQLLVYVAIVVVGIIAVAIIIRLHKRAKSLKYAFNGKINEFAYRVGYEIL